MTDSHMCPALDSLSNDISRLYDEDDEEEGVDGFVGEAAAAAATACFCTELLLLLLLVGVLGDEPRGFCSSSIYKGEKVRKEQRMIK